MATAKVVSPSEYLTARLALLEKEKALTRANDGLAAQRRALPLVEIKKSYTFTALDSARAETSVSFLDLFEHRRQLIVKHIMFDPSWDAACKSCSMGLDYLNSLEHLWSRDTSVVCVSRAPIQKIEACKKRMGWTFPWVSSYGSDFNYDFHVTLDANVSPVQYNFRDEAELVARGLTYSTTGEQPGLSCFIRGGRGVGEEGKVYHTYSTYARGMDRDIETVGMLDLTFLGRQQKDMQPADKRRDEYTDEELKGSM